MNTVARIARASRSRCAWGRGIHFQPSIAQTMAHPSRTSAWVVNTNLSRVCALIFGLPPVCARASRTSAFCFSWVSVSGSAILFIRSSWVDRALRRAMPFQRVGCKLPSSAERSIHLTRLHPAAQHFRHAPGLRDATPGMVRLAGVKYFADRADAIFVHAFGKSLQELAGLPVLAGMDLEPGIDERPDQPRPDRSLVVGAIARPQVAGIKRFVIRMFRRERTKTDRRDQLLFRDIDHRFPARRFEHRMVERDREQLVRPAGWIVRGPAVHVHHVIKMPAFFKPETLIERLACAFRLFLVTPGVFLIAAFA